MIDIDASVFNPDPAVRAAFESFRHNTTRYVLVPHGAKSELQLSLDRRCQVVIWAAGQEVFRQVMTAPGASLPLSEMKMPPANYGGFIPQILNIPSFGIGRRSRPTPQAQDQRLYLFTVEIFREPSYEEMSRKSSGALLAKYDFHILCDVDFRWAAALDRELQENPAKLGDKTIYQQVEGTCPHCQVVRKHLEDSWS